MQKIQLIDLTVEDPESQPSLAFLTDGSRFNEVENCWEISALNEYFRFQLRLNQKQGATLLLKIRSAAGCSLKLSANGQEVAVTITAVIGSFSDAHWDIPVAALVPGNNELRLELSDECKFPVQANLAAVNLYQKYADNKTWMRDLPETTLLGDVNLPGTHDSAAITSVFFTPFTCQSASITDQLEAGVRLLDVRLKVYLEGGQYSFSTCHGDPEAIVGDPMNQWVDFHLNAFQTFPSLIDECAAFLQQNSCEVIAMLLKMDDWNGYDKDAARVLKALQTLLDSYHFLVLSAYEPTLEIVRGKMVVYHRLDTSPLFGAPINWAYDTPGSDAFGSANRRFSVFVQDRGSSVKLDEKFGLVTAAIAQKATSRVVLNFASYTALAMPQFDINRKLIEYLGSLEVKDRPKRLGWMLFNYALSRWETDTYPDVNVVELLIASNRGYYDFDGPFKLFKTVKPGYWLAR